MASGEAGMNANWPHVRRVRVLAAAKLPKNRCFPGVRSGRARRLGEIPILIFHPAENATGPGTPARADVSLLHAVPVLLCDPEENPPSTDAAFPQVPRALHPVARWRNQRILAELLQSFDDTLLQNPVQPPQCIGGRLRHYQAIFHKPNSRFSSSRGTTSPRANSASPSRTAAQSASPNGGSPPPSARKCRKRLARGQSGSGTMSIRRWSSSLAPMSRL